MAEIVNKRVCAEIEGNFVLFLIGVRINRAWKVAAWLPVFMAMPKMLSELEAQPELGLLHYRTHLGFPNAMVVQYWRSVEQLQAYAEARGRSHLPAWQAFNKAVGVSGDVGIWHETYVIGPGQSENIYVNMPAYGMGRAGTVFEAKGTRANATKRLAAGSSGPAI